MINNNSNKIRKSSSLIKLARDTNLSVDDLILPIFIREDNQTIEIPAMHGQHYLSLDSAIDKCKEAYQLGIPGIMVFNVLKDRDDDASIALKKSNFEEKVFKRLKDEVGDKLTVISNVCLCTYTKDEYCFYSSDGKILNQKTAEMLGKISVLHANAGADVIAPAAMVDGQVKSIRESLNDNGHDNVPIMTYIKTNSSLFDPFYNAMSDSTCSRNDVAPSMTRIDALSEKMFLQKLNSEIEEGADIVIIKPALPNLDLIRLAKETHPEVYLSTYQVSGEYVMIKSTSESGQLIESKVVMETLSSMKRAGADMILTYFALDVAKMLRSY